MQQAKLFRRLLVAALVMECISGRAFASPEQDRVAFIALYRGKFPAVPLENYVDGALMLSRDAKAQFDSIMEFPPFQADIDKGRDLWATPFKNGKIFAGCFAEGGHDVAGNFPYYDPRSDKVVTFEMAINRCLRDNGEAEYKFNDKATMGTLTAYVRTLSDGMHVDVRVEGEGALAKYESGKKRYFTRMGQYNFACG